MELLFHHNKIVTNKTISFVEKVWCACSRFSMQCFSLINLSESEVNKDSLFAGPSWLVLPGGRDTILSWPSPLWFPPQTCWLPSPFVSWDREPWTVKLLVEGFLSVSVRFELKIQETKQSRINITRQHWPQPPHPYHASLAWGWGNEWNQVTLPLSQLSLVWVGSEGGEWVIWLRYPPTPSLPTQTRPNWCKVYLV